MVTDEVERWDDLEIEENSFMYRTTRGIYSCYPDKEVALLCQRVLSPPLFDDDDSISTVTSQHSDRFTMDEHDYFLNDIGSLMVSTSLSTQSKTPSSTLRSTLSSTSSTKQQLKQQQTTSSTAAAANDNDVLSELLKGYNGPGKITRLGQPGRIQKDYGDWTHDIQIPNIDSLQQQKINQQKQQQQPINKTNSNNNKDRDHLLLFDDDDDDDPFTKIINDGDDNIFKENHFTKQKRVRFGDDAINNNHNKMKNINNSQEQKSSSTATHRHRHQQQRQKQKLWFEESDDEGFDDISLPDDINTLSLKNRLSNKTSNTLKNNNNNNKMEKTHQLPTHLEKIQHFKEDDQDDFMDGLDNINDETFKIRNINKKMKQQQQQQQQQIESKLSRSKKLQHHSSISSSSPFLSVSQSKKPSSYENKLQRLTAPTYSSRQRTITNNNNANTYTSSSSSSSSSYNNNNNNNNNNNLHPLRTRKSDYNLRKETTNLHSGSQRTLLKNNHSLSTLNSKSILQQQQKNKYPLTTKRHLLLPNSKATTTASPNLMTRPRGSRFNHYGNGTELDNLDDLPTWKKSNLYNYNRTTFTNSQKIQDTTKPWRQNMSKRNLKLIKPNDQALESKINGMKYDSKNKQWKGNEQAMKSFEEPAKKRPALIKNMMRSKSIKCSKAVSVGDMVFDQEQMRWNSSNGHEIDIFSHINDLFDDTINSRSNINTTYSRRPSKLPLKSSYSSSSSSSLNKYMFYTNDNNNNNHHHHHQVPIFYISDEMKIHMQELEVEHKEQFSTWPLYEDNDTIKNQYGHTVPQYAYILY